MAYTPENIPGFAAHAAKHPWLEILFKSYACVDSGITRALAREAKRHRYPACHKGCELCCLNQAIPITPLEVAGLAWYVQHIVSVEIFQDIVKNIQNIQKYRCPFLLRGSCSVYPVRPVACRQYIIFNTPCAPGEDVFVTRREDVLIPLPEYKLRADKMTLPYYGITGKNEQAQALREGYLRKNSQLLFTCNWEFLIK